MKTRPKKDLSQPPITTICDKYKTRKDLEPSWKFSCLISHSGKNILFNTGGVITLENLKYHLNREAMNIQLALFRISMVYLLQTGCVIS